MICPDKARSEFDITRLPDTLRNLRHFSQAEAHLLGSVNYCFFPSPFVDSAPSMDIEDTQQQSSSRSIKVPG